MRSRRLAGLHVGFEFSLNSKREAKNLFHLRAIKWIPESPAPARRRGFFFFTPGFITRFLSLAPAEGMLTFFSHKATFPSPESHRDHRD